MLPLLCALSALGHAFAAAADGCPHFIRAAVPVRCSLDPCVCAELGHDSADLSPAVHPLLLFVVGRHAEPHDDEPM